MNKQITILKHYKGFSLVELMVSMAIGLFLIAGVFTVYINSRSSQDVVDDQMLMVDSARFALDIISADIRQAGVFGRVKESFKITTSSLVYGTGGCVADTWVQDISFPVRAYDDDSSLLGSCATNYSQGDVLEIRYSLLTPVPAASLQANKIYINGNVNESIFFLGDASPGVADGADYEYVANAYYIAGFSDAAGDGIPSLHRLTLQPGGVTDQVLLTGVEDMQVQIGMDTDADGSVDSYVDPSTLDPTDNALWSRAKSVEIWLVVRSLRSYPGLDTVINANIAGADVTIPADGNSDGIRRIVVSAVAKIRNR